MGDRIFKMAVTSLRPKKLSWGYNYNESHWLRLSEILKNEIVTKKPTDVYTGMALGGDTVFALTCIELKNSGFPLRIHAAIPCSKQYGRWVKEAQDLYFKILSNMDEIVGMSETKGIQNIRLFSHKDLVGNNVYDLVKSDAINANAKSIMLTEDMLYEQSYKGYLMQKRNEYMVDNINELIAVWDGQSGGTANCVNYAKKKGIAITQIDPNNI